MQDPSRRAFVFVSDYARVVSGAYNGGKAERVPGFFIFLSFFFLSFCPPLTSGIDVFYFFSFPE